MPRSSPRSSIAARVALGLALLVLPLAVVSTWLNAVLINTTQYVATVTPLASDPTVQTATEQALVREAWGALESSPTLRGLARQREDRIIALLEEAATRVVRDPAFVVAWEEANRSAHQQLMAILSGEESALVAGDGRVSIQLDTLLSTVFSILSTEGLVTEDQIPDLEASFTLASADELERARTAYDVLHTLGFWLPVLWVVLVIAALTLSKNRRRTVRWLGLTSIIAMLALAIGLLLGRDYVVSVELLEDPVVALAVWDILIVGLKTAVWSIGGVAVLVAALSLVRRGAR